MSAIFLFLSANQCFHHPSFLLCVQSESPVKGRKKIRHVIHEDELEEGTKNAAKEEEDRRKRIAARQKMVPLILYITPLSCHFGSQF